MGSIKVGDSIIITTCSIGYLVGTIGIVVEIDTTSAKTIWPYRIKYNKIDNKDWTCWADGILRSSLIEELF